MCILGLLQALLRVCLSLSKTANLLRSNCKLSPSPNRPASWHWCFFVQAPWRQQIQSAERFKHHYPARPGWLSAVHEIFTKFILSYGSFKPIHGNAFPVNSDACPPRTCSIRVTVILLGVAASTQEHSSTRCAFCHRFGAVNAGFFFPLKCCVTLLTRSEQYTISPLSQAAVSNSSALILMRACSAGNVYNIDTSNSDMEGIKHSGFPQGGCKCLTGSLGQAFFPCRQ